MDVKHIAKLANIRLTEEEEKIFFPQLASIISYVEKLKEVDTKNIEPTAQITGLTNVFRDDEIDTSRMLSQEEALKNSPATHKGFIKVKAIL